MLAPSEYVYERRRPEAGSLHQVVRENLRSLYAAAELGFATSLPLFVRDELEGYLACGLLCRGFALLACTSADCSERKLVAFSCHGRGFCPSCLGRRMAEHTANLVDHVLPPRVPLRQFVLTLPFELRYRLAYDSKLLGKVTRIFVDTVLGFYRRKLAQAGTLRGTSGAVTAIQRVSSDLRLNPHMHTIALDGVFAVSSAGELAFHELPCLETSDVADLMQVVRVRILSYLVRARVIESACELTVLEDTLAEREPALAQLAAAAVSGLAPAGPELRRREPVALRTSPGVEVVGSLSVTDTGFSLHAATTASAQDATGREALVRYVLRPPIAQERLELLPDGLARIRLRRPFRDGTVAIDLDPLSLLCRLAAAVPPPKFHTLRYAGVLAAAHKLRPLVVPPAPDDDAMAAAHGHDEATPKRPATHRSRYWPWAQLLRRTFQIDVEECSRCGAPMKLRALVISAVGIERILRHIGEPTEPPPLSPARGPPFFKSRVLRRGPGELRGAVRGQVKMFDT
jgi:hypothetical protein